MVGMINLIMGCALLVARAVKYLLSVVFKAFDYNMAIFLNLIQ